jgi:outer membrane protein W
MKTIAACLFAMLAALPAAAQSSADPAGFSEPPEIGFRGFFVATAQSFAAKTTVDAAFASSTQPFFGGGVQLTSQGGFYIEFGVTQFKKSGQRAFVSNGQTFGLGIPLTATVTPIELSAGYRFGVSKWKVIPYAGGGIGRYNYKEESDFSNGDNVDTHSVGYLAFGGVEFRVQKYIGLAVDVQYTHVPGILGVGGVSKEVGETDLGGIAARFKVLVGR